MMHFSLFRFPLFPTNLSDSAENFPTLTFSLKNFRFSSAKISDDLFLVVHHKFLIPPHFPVSIHFPLFREIFLSPYFCTFPASFHKIYVFFYILYMYFLSPYFYHHAFKHHTMMT